jgi:hypothetical protein
MIAGSTAAGLAGLLSGLGAVAAVVILTVAVMLLTYVHAGMGTLLHPRLVHAILARMEGGGPGPEAPDGPEAPVPAV